MVAFCPSWNFSHLCGIDFNLSRYLPPIWHQLNDPAEKVRSDTQTLHPEVRTSQFNNQNNVVHHTPCASSAVIPSTCRIRSQFRVSHSKVIECNHILIALGCYTYIAKCNSLNEQGCKNRVNSVLQKKNIFAPIS